jgi:tetratricopeptide (TPR) repeat protein
MNESPNTMIEALKIITEFLSNSSISIFLLVLLIVCREAISSLISRLTSFSFKNRDSMLGMKAAAPSEGNENIKELLSADEKPSPEEKDSKTDEVDGKERKWFSEMYKALEEENLDDAEKIFKEYALNEKDEVKLEENKASYLYFRFKEGKDNLAIEELEDLARTVKTEDSKFTILTLLSFCLRDSMQYGKEIEVWRSAVKEIESESLKTRAIANLANALNKEDGAIEAKKLIVERLSSAVDDTQKSTLYEALSKIEQSLGNKSISIYCKDKSLEFDVNNRDELFNSAYAASDEDIDEISISNYIKLIRIDDKNSTALNNLGVRAQGAGLKIKAVDNYKKSSDYNNTLAMANQGYLLLEAGFADEADKIAKQALDLDNPHQNVHSLIAAINDKKQEQNEGWDKLREKSLSRQKMIRKYTEQYYLGNSNLLKGDWLIHNTYPTSITIEKDIIKAAWVESAGVLSGGSSDAELIGKVSGSTFEGTYTRKRNESTLLGGLSGNTNQSCIGYISDDGNEIKIASPKLKDSFTLCLSKPKA